MQLTLIPLGASSLAKDFVKPNSADFDAATKSCDSGHDEDEGGRYLCDGLNDIERDIHSILNECPTCSHKNDGEYEEAEKAEEAAFE